MIINPLTEENPDEFKVDYQTGAPANVTLAVHGAGLTYDGSGNVTGGTVTSFDILDNLGTVYATFAGFSASATTFYSAITNNNLTSSNGRYQYLVSLLNDNTTVTGGPDNDGIEVGAGNDTVAGNAGNDIVFKWQPGNLTYDGGPGSDTLSFQAFFGRYPTEPAAGAVVNLTTGTGTNPYGGSLHLTSVENIIGTDKADHLTGNNEANIFGDGIYDIGADIINCLGGNDTVNLAELNGGGVRADGGTGIDTLAVNFATIVVGLQRLDLVNQALNADVFHNDVFTNFEIFVHGSGFFAASGQTFIFVDNNESHTVEAMGQTNRLTLNGDSDKVIIYDSVTNYSVIANGGAGTDTVDLGQSLLGGANVLDLVHQADNSGIFAHSTYTSFEVFTGARVAFAPTGAGFVFRGSNAAERITGTYHADTLSGGGGNDTLNGGLGDDRLIGGPGKDTFVFNTAIAPVQNIDTIVGFSPWQDTIELDKAIFKGIGGNGVLAASHFDMGAHAAHASDRIIYNPNTGALLYDSNGSAPGHETEFAILAKHLALSHADFLVI